MRITARRCCASTTATSARCCTARPTRSRSPTSSATAIKSYRDLPKNLYHIQWKFRDEVRPRFGVMRGREFLMKDAYSFDLDAAGAKHSYNKMFVAYLRTFARMGLKAIPMRADTGPIGGDLSHEFHILAETGESEVLLRPALARHRHPRRGGRLRRRPRTASSSNGPASTPRPRKCTTRANCPIPADQLVTARGIEVGQIFYFGTKYSKPMGARRRRPRRRGSCRSRWAPTASACRAWSAP